MLKTKLLDIKNIFQHSRSFQAAWEECQSTLKALFDVDQLVLFKRDPKQTELFFQIERNAGVEEMRVPFSFSSVAGFTALSQAPLMLQNLDPRELAAVHPDLRFDRGLDKLLGLEIINILSMPVHHENALMGVFQLINKKSGKFTRQDEAYCRLIVGIMGQKLFEEFDLPQGPFDHLVSKGFLTQEQLDDALSRAAQRGVFVSRVLRADFNLDPDAIGASLERFYQTPFVRYENNPVSDQMLKGINRQYLIRNMWLPLHTGAGKAVVLVQDPHDADTVNEIRRVVNAKSYEFRVGLPEDILAFLGDSSQLPKSVSPGGGGWSTGAEEGEPEDLTEELDDGDDLSASLAELATAAEEGLEFTQDEEEDISLESRQVAVRFVNKVIMHAHRVGASDIHIEPNRVGKPGLVRMRIDGTCERVLSIPESVIKPVTSRIKIMSRLDISEKRLPQDGKLRVRFKGREIEMRVATLPTVYGESVVMRMLSAGKVMPFSRLNLSARNAEQIERIMVKPHGIFLVVGTTGSGKTTTLHSILSRINTPDKKIWTVEDPVEITQQGLQQVQVENAIGLDFARIMRSFLRADPDVILVGEMRDLETAQIGVEASLTGHLVFTTLHTNSAAETVTRLLDMGIESLNFAEALQGILAQRLVKTLCVSCRAAHEVTDEEWDYLVSQYGSEYFPELGIERSGARTFKPVGCRRCSHTGYRGRTGIHELLVTTPEIRKAIMRKQPAEDIERLAVEQGMRTLYQDGIAKIFQGDIDTWQLQKVTVSD
ncbi:MAG: Flp pilus assembly complex ATPase component TadA [Desulfovibrionales bacterium]|nr:Flp pilus assembly complex ATPase component TadA [Desulfovibrionales bacterium]